MSTLLLKKHGIPARVVTGVPGSDNISGPGHAWTEYRDGTQWRQLDATPYLRPPEWVAEEMYTRELEINTKLETERIAREKAIIDNIMHNFHSLPEEIKARVYLDNPKEIDFENTELTTEQLEIVIEMLSLNKRNQELETLVLSGTNISRLPDNYYKILYLKELNIGSTILSQQDDRNTRGISYNFFQLERYIVPQDWDLSTLPKKLKSKTTQEIIVRPSNK